MVPCAGAEGKIGEFLFGLASLPDGIFPAPTLHTLLAATSIPSWAVRQHVIQTALHELAPEALGVH